MRLEPIYLAAVHKVHLKMVVCGSQIPLRVGLQIQVSILHDDILKNDAKPCTILFFGIVQYTFVCTACHVLLYKSALHMRLKISVSSSIVPMPKLKVQASNTTVVLS